MKTAETRSPLLHNLELYFFKECRITDLEEREREELVRRGGIAQEIAIQREHSCDGEKPKSHFGQPKLLEKLTTCTAPQTKEQGMFTWRSGGKSARTDGVAPALLSHLRRLRPLQKPRDLWGAVSCALPLCCRKMHLHLPCTRRAALVLYI